MFIFFSPPAIDAIISLLPPLRFLYAAAFSFDFSLPLLLPPAPMLLMLPPPLMIIFADFLRR